MFPKKSEKETYNTTTLSTKIITNVEKNDEDAGHFASIATTALFASRTVRTLCISGIEFYIEFSL